MLPNPLGGNEVRLGALVGGPLLLCALLAARRRIGVPVAVLLVAFAGWQWSAAVRDIAHTSGDRATEASFYTPLNDFLGRARDAGGGPFRVEIPLLMASPAVGGPEMSKWTRVAHAFVMDWSMLWKEILGGFLIAGFLATLVPHDWWEGLFLQSGPPVVRLIENALIGPIIAMISFVCSVGNIPLASLLWSHGISFGGVISFIYADLIVIPIIIIYAKYYGARAAAWITAIFYVSMVLAGIIVDLVFSACGLIPQGSRPPSAIEHAHVIWNYTSWLDVAAAIFAAWLLFLHFKSRDKQLGHACH